MEAPNPIDRRQAERRSPGRRMIDRLPSERTARRLRMDDPVRIAMWELEAERALRAGRERVSRLQELTSFKY